jgi:hypothetical protein
MDVELGTDNPDIARADELMRTPIDLHEVVFESATVFRGRACDRLQGRDLQRRR